MKRKLLYGHILSLLTGGLIYILFRTSTLKMFSWFDKLGLTETINSARSLTLHFSEILPNWFKFSLPDGLWIFSYVCLLLLIWRDKGIRKSIHWTLIIPIIAIISELGQLTNIVPGTFDPVDLTFYLLGTILPFLIVKSSIIKTQTT